jgi:exodeoxyribonuclease VII large subunit
LRAPTPSAGAELAVDDVEQLFDRIESYKETLNRCMAKNMEAPKNRLENMTLRLKYLSPANQIQQKRTYCMDLEDRLTKLMNDSLTDNSHRLAIYVEKLKGISPLDKLSQGYSYMEDENHKVVNNINNVKAGDIVNIYVKNGKVEAMVRKTMVNTTTEVEYGG